MIELVVDLVDWFSVSIAFELICGLRGGGGCGGGSRQVSLVLVTHQPAQV